ncbi:MAG: hypothetical protein NZ578_09695 [Candidatus Binatia bacterium]|nr:hypothetical protein [Candidatus Binatia bacterium]
MSLREPRHATVTAVWVTLNAIPLVVLVLLGIASKSWLVGICLVLLYPILLIPYGILVSLPLMVKIFRRPSTPPPRWPHRVRSAGAD